MLDALIPEGGLNLLRFLRSKDSLTLFKNELRLQEKEILTADQPMREAFYKQVCDLLRMRMIRDYDEKFTRQYVEKYFQSFARRHPDEQWLIEAHMLSKKLWAMQSFDFDKDTGPLYREYKKVYSHLAPSAEKESVYARIALRISVENLTGKLSNNTIKEIDAAINTLLQQSADPYEVFTLGHQRIFVLQQLGRSEEVLKYAQEFENTFTQFEPNGDSLYIMWVLNAIVIADIPMMEYALYKIEEKHRGETHPGRRTPLLLCKAYSALIQRQEEKFSAAIDEVKELNQGEHFSLITEIVMRRLETACHFCKDDTEFVMALIEKNLKFHKYHKTNIRKPQLIEFYNIARAMTIAKETGTPLKAMTLKKINVMRGKEMLIWRTLMEMQKSLV